jgi:ubiquinone/menaquinone biosynthesis C-methylase UbiE
MAQSDYNDPTYDYTKYWATREYENLAEQTALRKLLPKQGVSILDVGGGFGRLSLTYHKVFQNITLFDLSSRILEQGITYTKSQGFSIKTIEGSVYDLSKLTKEKYDCVLMIRVAHHLSDLGNAFRSIHSVLKPNGIFILEFANKINFKSVLRNFRKDKFFGLEPTSIATKSVNFYNFHPLYVENALYKAGFVIDKKLSVSNFRSLLLKKTLPLSALVNLESLAQTPLASLNFGPSIFLRCSKK